jgi:hypothetical protein
MSEIQVQDGGCNGTAQGDIQRLARDGQAIKAPLSSLSLLLPHYLQLCQKCQCHPNKY